MRLSEFEYELPPEAIARHPTASRDGSRLMTLDRKSGRVGHHVFSSLAEHLRPGDLVVVNDTRVRAARLLCKKVGTGGRVEVLLVEPEGQHWLALAQSSKPLKPGTALLVEGTDHLLEVVERRDQGWILIGADDDLGAISDSYGQLPLPPYMERAPEATDADRYQTIFARADRLGSVAAPTAGLHFTEAVNASLRSRDISMSALTLHVGPGTFLPVRVDDPRDHRMHAERYAVPAETAAAIETTRRSGGRIVAVGTTVTRVLESIDDPTQATSGVTDLFIRPGFTFRHVDALITNFHLPRSTLLMLVCAFAGRVAVLAAYEQAVRTGYRFYSYGDAMLIQ